MIDYFSLLAATLETDARTLQICNFMNLFLASTAKCFFFFERHSDDLSRTYATSLP